MKILLATEGAKMPTKADKGAAGFDLYTSEDFIVKPGRSIVPTGLKMGIDYGYEGHIRPRSGFSAKGMEGYIITDGEPRMDESHRFNADVVQGTVDASYRGLVGVIVRSNEQRSFFIPKGTRIAQMVFEQCYMGELEVVTTLDDTERSEGGFGSSGTK